MKKILLLLLAVVASTTAIAQQPSLSLPASQADWFREARFGMFVHFGLYSMLEGSYNGRTLPDTTLPHGRSWYAEWIQMRLEVPADQYRKLAERFNPHRFDADAWIAEAKNAGMRYFVITAKHHDGFALWDSKVSTFNIMHTPYGRDLVAQLVDACRRHGIKYGFYYSHWQDWEYPGGAMPEWYPKVPDAEFEKYWQQKSLPQVRELITMFDPDLLWFDTWDWETHITDHRRDELIALVRSLSPKCLINGRISYLNPGTDIDFLEMHDNQYPDRILDKPWQTPATMTHSWGWHARDFNWKPSAQMIGYLAGNAAMGGNYLLNIGPRPDGTFPAPAIRRLREIGAWMLVNSEAIYGTQPVKEIETDGNVTLTRRTVDGRTTLYATARPMVGHIDLPIPAADIERCTLLETGRPIVVVGTDNQRSSLQIPPPRSPRDHCHEVNVYKIELKKR